ncbi:TPA: bifunctional demethylmenaquinone methyltransferase/2-methoxy-6-polyprenyl-1,4-benzoquinol methylase UbiE [Legionella pneumophila subsp. pneumophila]|uniref:bifunctional demethylmenaquinone methyltransferase/2-methoxy-6-polyprenyl-1,4-benzoquinol methylase UbiE n=1 Tax=Legionella pneumophila TaxID=446 RepID=UPI00077077C5|nr:bifunctional demethylmenaquinone methyltransferase/2-methoxy-6-polyprenyl-1,4-benzoquinol methylase UbiE [Legionella pneumophila]HAT9214744.1 bifunctional demethylmenaquinone methyltransferase/2-methoxy-6-polyprenyl-1,4-benzoquinol methylase UbiE [Legionella pneumophila subsp. pneumophila]CZI40972.1 Ubiquinone/menaquinone biosynthesis methyltransferase ubiE [Legionella pneumophila]HAT9261154.1 bifunctional demethylmenaquinone methyltransferase/2-methoxy-6-polyprenyl-1,4-benzoquinol methylase 
MTKQKQTTHFGFKSVDWNEKEKKVAEVFHSVAKNYDRMNDLMSLGIHHLWKRYTIELSHVRPGQSVLDLAGGSGDLTRLLSQKVGDSGQVVLADINAAMLHVGRDRLLDEGLFKNIRYVQGNAQCLPFADNSFHCITMGFGLRNVTDKDEALQSMYRVCKPGGKLMVLEFSTPVFPGLKPVYDWYSFNILPKIGKFVANDEASYQYLAESIRMHPDQETLKAMIERVGFEDCHYHNLSGGIVALHIAYKY